MAKNFWTGESPGSSSGSSAVDTLIGRQTEVLGDVRFSGGLHIDGKIIGKVIATADKGATLSVSEAGIIEGDVRAPKVVLNGLVQGDVVSSENLTLGARARIAGSVYYKNIEMMSGAVINGQLVHEGDDSMAAPRALNDSRIEGISADAKIKSLA